MIDIAGVLVCSRYSFAPNSYHFCGPERQLDMLGYVSNRVADRGLADILHRFETLYKYLVFIASQNNIKDPFDRRVVEAYWLGNSLLGGVGRSALAHLLTDSLLPKRIRPGKLTPIVDQVIDGGIPHHSFHVLNIFVRTGHNAIPHTLETMDSCRISWGKILSNTANQRVKDRHNEQHYVIETRRLEYQNRALRLSTPVTQGVASIAVTPKIGEWVSVHWGYICDVLSREQKYQLEKYTALAINVANRQKILDV